MQGFNAQLAVSEDHLILAAELVATPNDTTQFVPMMRATLAGGELLSAAAGTDEGIGLLLADAGYLSEANLTEPGPPRLIAVGRRRDMARAAREAPAEGPRRPRPGTATEQMRHRLRTPEGAALFKRRGALVEAVNGDLKDHRGLRRFARRGIQAARSELRFTAAVHNLLKLHRAQRLARC